MPVSAYLLIKPGRQSPRSPRVAKLDGVIAPRRHRALRRHRAVRVAGQLSTNCAMVGGRIKMLEGITRTVYLSVVNR